MSLVPLWAATLGFCAGLTMGVSVRAAAPGRVGEAAQSRSVAAGVYTAEQSKRGQTTYEQECANCHSLTLTGGDGAPGLIGEEFNAHWNGRTVADLFERTQTTMPQDSPGRLRRQQYADILAYLLSANQLPAGQMELESDVASLRQIRWEAKGSR